MLLKGVALRTWIFFQDIKKIQNQNIKLNDRNKKN
jgi:hypothetical protein